MPVALSIPSMSSIWLTRWAAKVGGLWTYEQEGRRAHWAELTGLPVEEPSVDQVPK